MSKYSNLPYMEQTDLPTCRYTKACAVVAPLRNAINSARALPEESMDSLLAILRTATKHIESALPNEPETEAKQISIGRSDTGDDPLDGLCGPLDGPTPGCGAPD